MKQRTRADTALLTWQAEREGLRFRVATASGQPVAPADWGSLTVRHEDGRASIAPLLTLFEDEDYLPDADASMLIPHARVAAWDRHQIAQLGLPPVAPFHLSIRC
jgi:hypothetical protein